ncbi:MAG TPA: hypothetical protein VHP14_25600 [Anaerolineales bacterium]|nr:hypothetical protein [Anaerolineales bacterium]
MTTKAGLVGISTGILTTIILVIVNRSLSWSWFTLVLPAMLILCGGYLAGRRSGTHQPWRSSILGGLAGMLAGCLIFCLFGAAAAGMASRVAQSSLAIVRQTCRTFLICFWGGIGLGALGGWLAYPFGNGAPDTFNKSEPQMALNASITAVPASVVAAAASAVVFSHLGRSALDWALGISLMLVLISHLILTLVVPHETHEAEHRCGMDEVKMAAYVGIAAAPVLALLLFLIGRQLFLHPLVIVSLVISSGLSLRSLHTLFRLILPRRAEFPAPQTAGEKAAATFFGTIAASHGPRLVVLCIGCGLVMVLPLYVTVFSLLVNLLNPPSDLFQTQALWSGGLMVGASAILSGAYLFYLNLGRWFNKQVHQPKGL